MIIIRGKASTEIDEIQNLLLDPNNKPLAALNKVSTGGQCRCSARPGQVE
jgi:hypothetical protein